MCKIEGCERPHYARGLCALHWQRVRNGTPLDKPIQAQQSRAGRTCRIEGCDREPRTTRELCHAHYMRQRNGTALDGPIRVQGPRTDWDTLLGDAE